MASVARSNYYKALFVTTLVASVVTIGAVVGYHVSTPEGAVIRGVHIAGAHIGGLTPDQAEALLARHIDGLLERPILLYLGGESWTEIPRGVGVKPDLKATISRAYAVGRSGSLVRRIHERFIATKEGYEIPVEVVVDQARFDSWLKEVAARIERPPKDAEIQVGARGEVEIVPAQVGYRLQAEGVLERVARAVFDPRARAVRLSVSHIQPAVTTADARAIGVRRMIASFTTRFDPSDVNRTANIHIAADALDGLLLAPGELFSFNRHVGPRVEAAGYKEAPVIIDGELVPDIGGGVCQVSTTLYSAVLLAGLKVDTRVPHSIPASYVPLGLDATVAYDYIDFRFRNNTAGHVLVKSWVEGDRVTVALFGDGPQFEWSRLVTEVVDVMPPKVVREYRPELKNGEQRIVKHGREGYRVNVWRVARTTDGKELRELVANSVYQPRERVIWVGGEASRA